jgi:hypothetical protein
MQRRDVLRTATAAAAATTIAAPAIAQGRLQWKMVTSRPRNLPGPGVAGNRTTVSLPGSQTRQMVSPQSVWVSMTRQSSPCSGQSYQLYGSIRIFKQLA